MANACLTFEDGGGSQPVPPRRLEALAGLDPVSRGVCLPPQKGASLVAAGVKHVVAVSLDEPLLDAAAVAFTRAFYHALSVGDSAKGLDGGAEAVAASPE